MSKFIIRVRGWVGFKRIEVGDMAVFNYLLAEYANNNSTEATVYENSSYKIGVHYFHPFRWNEELFSEYFSICWLSHICRSLSLVKYPFSIPKISRQNQAF